MGAMTTLPWGRELRAADLPSMPDDGHRYELIDGALIVTPSPTREHQAVVAATLVRLESSCPPAFRCLTAPLDVVYGDDTVVQPDLLVVPRSGYYDASKPLRPVLAVEVLSPSTRLIDLNLKKERYRRADCPSYWVIDPIALHLLAWDLVDGDYVQVGDVVGEMTWTATRPFPVTISPQLLL